jgi:signal transduction histidine kinase
MTALPLYLDPGAVPTPDDPNWTTLRFGLTFAWFAALVALVAVGLGGWSLIDLSERRIRFVTAVNHELRTPLTTLRLYIDMLLGGMVNTQEKRDEYLRTLEAETDRLTRLVGNVLDYSRLESQHPKLSLTTVAAKDVLLQVESAWQCRCTNAGKQLVIEDTSGEAMVHTDVALLGQILGNLLDNACKYSRDSSDPQVWLRARQEGTHVVYEVEDRGPGVPEGERRLIFRPFRRGRRSDATTGGVGLGLALACRWMSYLGGRLTLHTPASEGACFRVELPVDVSPKRDRP